MDRKSYGRDVQGLGRVKDAFLYDICLYVTLNERKRRVKRTQLRDVLGRCQPQERWTARLAE